MLDKCGHLLQRWKYLVVKYANTWCKRLGISNKLLNVGYLSGKDDI